MKLLKSTLSYSNIVDNHKLILLIGYLGLFITIFQMCYFHDHTMWDSFFFGQGNDHFMDFFNHVAYCEVPEKVYFQSYHACFPAFSYLFFYFINRLLPSGAVTMFHANDTTGYAYVVYLVYVVIFIVLFSYEVMFFLKDYKPSFSLIIEIQLLLSYSFVAGVFERGNICLIVLVSLVLAVYLKQKESTFFKELALLLIAFSTGLKVYPAIFALIYLTEHRYKEVLRLSFYIVVINLLPFAFFGGTTGLIQFFLNQMQLHTSYASSFSLFYTLNDLICLFGFSEAVSKVSSSLILGILLFLTIVGIFKAKDTYLKFILLVSIMVLFPLWSGLYTIAYFAIPLLIYLRDEKCLTPINIFMDVLFGLIFTSINFYLPFVNVNGINIVCIGAVYILYFLSLILAFKNVSYDMIEENY